MNKKSDYATGPFHRFAFLVGLISVVGCSSSDVEYHGSKKPNNLEAVYNAYQTANARMKRPPKNVQELKPFLPKGTSLDKIMKSEIDGKKYKVLWGFDIVAAQYKSAEPIIFAYETEGEDGVRWVATTMGMMQKKEEEFKNSKFAFGKTP